jgi:hypothetical protein
VKNPWVPALVGLGALGVVVYFANDSSKKSTTARKTNPAPPQGGTTVGMFVNLEPKALPDPRSLFVEDSETWVRELPNECDPLKLDELPQGYRCISAGGRWVSVPENGADRVPRADPAQVAVSANYAHFRIGPAWFRGVLGARFGGTVEDMDLTARGQLLATGWPYECVSTLRSPGAVLEFAKTHYVKTPGGGVRIYDLPSTPAMNELRRQICTAVVGVQG